MCLSTCCYSEKEFLREVLVINIQRRASNYDDINISSINYSTQETSDLVELKRQECFRLFLLSVIHDQSLSKTHFAGATLARAFNR